MEKHRYGVEFNVVKNGNTMKYAAFFGLPQIFWGEGHDEAECRGEAIRKAELYAQELSSPDCTFSIASCDLWQ